MFQGFSSYSFFKLIEQQSNKTTRKNLILEPISCIMKLIILQYKKEGTKISVSDNSILYNEPTIIQGILRTFYGDCREDLHNLYHPLLKCVEWYSNDDPYFKFFYQEAKKGLLLLKDVYNDNTTIHHTISHYISIVDGTYNQKGEQINPIIDTLREIWTPAEIKTLYDLLKLIDKNKNKDIYLKALEDIVTAKELFINDYIQKISTSY